MQTNPTHSRARDILLLIFSILGILGLLMRGAYMTVTGIQSFDPADMASLAASMLGALGMLFCAALLLPMLAFTVKSLKGQESLPAVVRPVKFWQVAILVTSWVVIVIIGAVIAGQFDYGWAVAAPFFLLGVGMPIFGLAWISAGGLPSRSRRRLWSVFGIGDGRQHHRSHIAGISCDRGNNRGS